MLKSGAIKNISAVFNVEKSKVKSAEIPSEKIYARIGELTLENDFLKIAFLICKSQKRKMIDFNEKKSVSK